MDSKLIKEWMAQGLKPSSFEFFTNRPDFVVGKLPEQNAKVEYICPYCKFYEIKEVEMEKNKSGKKFLRPAFNCSKCGKVIKVESLKKK
jgi:hypothetical protein